MNLRFQKYVYYVYSVYYVYILNFKKQKNPIITGFFPTSIFGFLTNYLIFIDFSVIFKSTGKFFQFLQLRLYFFIISPSSSIVDIFLF